MASSSPSCICQQTFGKDFTIHPPCIGQLWLFEGLSPEERATLGPKLCRRKHAAGEILFHQGDPGDRMILLKAGSVKLSTVTEDGRVVTLDVRKAGDLLGESVFIEESDFPVTATCLEPTLTCGISRATLEEVILHHPTVGLGLVRNLSRRIKVLTEKLGALSEPMLEDRLYQVLVRVAQDVGHPRPRGWVIEFPLSHEEIGFLVGAHRVSVTRAMARLREEGRIYLEGKHLFVLQASQLLEHESFT